MRAARSRLPGALVARRAERQDSLVAKKPLYRVRFVNEGKVFELYARSVGQGALFGFIEVTELVWGRRSQVIVDPSEQELKNEFAGVSRIHVPMHAVLRIDEVDKSGGGKIVALRDDAEKATSTAFPIYTPGAPGKGK